MERGLVRFVLCTLCFVFDCSLTAGMGLIGYAQLGIEFAGSKCDYIVFLKVESFRKRVGVWNWIVSGEGMG